MKTKVSHLKEILQENKEDLKYLLFVGVPTGIIEILIHRFKDLSHLF